MKQSAALALLAILLCLAASDARAQVTLGASCPTSGWITVQPDQIVYCNASNVWAIGEEILSSGYVGIGTTGPDSTLSVSGGVAIGTTYAGTNAAGSNNLIVQGSVGIGTTTPLTPLDVYMGTNMGEFVAGNIGYNSIKIGNKSDALLAFMANNVASMSLYPDGGVAIGSTYYGTDPGSNNLIVQGNVGIGTTSPSTALQVNGAATLGINATTTGTLLLANGAGSGASTTVAPSSGTTSAWTMTLPTSGGTSGYCLTTDGSGHTTWTACVSALSTIDLGTSASTTNPHRASDATTGLFSATVGTVSVAASGTDSIDFSATGVNLSTLGEGYSINSASFGSQNVVWIPPAAADPTNFSVALGQNTLVSDNHSTPDQDADGDNGEYNTAVGQEALYDNTGGAYNTAVGAASLQDNTIGEDNTALGYDALHLVTTGASNTAIGSDVGSTTLTTGSGNILIGTSNAVDTPTATTSNFLDIGNVIFATGMTGSLSSPAGSVGIGTTAPLAALDVQAGITAASNLAYGTRLKQTLTTAANNDVLYGLYINPTYSNAGAYTGTSNIDIGFNGQSARSIAMARETTAATAGNNLTITAGGATSGATNVNGGNLILAAGTATGNNGSEILLQAAIGGNGSGTTDRTPATIMTINGALDSVGWQAGGASGSASTAWGDGTSATNTYATAWGMFNTASAQASTVWGNHATASGNQSTAWGGDYGNSLHGGTASGTVSTAFGIFTTASGYASTALGEYAMAGDGTAGDGKGNYSVAFGLSNTNTTTYPQITGTGDMGIFMQDQHNDAISANNVMALMGGSLYINPASGGGTTVSSVAQPLQVVGGATISGSVGIGTTSPSTTLQVNGAATLGINATTTGTLLLANGGGSGASTTIAPSSGTTSAWTMTLPTSGGTGGYCLLTNGSGVTSWGSCTGGGMTVIDLGTSATATNPSRATTLNTGLFSATVGTVSVAANGTDSMDFSATGVNLSTLGEGYSINSAGFGSQNVVWIPPAASDPTNFSLAIGQNALVNDTNTGGGDNGEYNTAVGQEALYDNTTGEWNTALGAAAMQDNTTGQNDTAVGAQALQDNTVGFNNTAVGMAALATNTSGNWNTAIGYEALTANTTGNWNTAMGLSALATNSGGNQNTAVGTGTLQLNSAGSQNTAIGNGTMYANTTGQNNVAIGYYALTANNIGNNNTALGYQTLSVNQAGYSNTAIGYNVASTTLNGGTGNILIGTSNAVDTPAAGTNNFLDIGNVIFATGMTGSLSSPAGNVGIGTTVPAATLDIVGAIYSRLVTVTYASSFTVNWSSSNVQTVTLTGNPTVTFSNGQAGARYIFIVKQDGSGSRTVTWSGSVRWPGGTAPTLTTTASKTDFIAFIYDGTYYNGVAISQNF